jgi:ABC-type sulfate/molybdate transport systems ATPase subunit
LSLSVSVTSRFGHFPLDVSFAAPPGITALFGASGAGKTLTLRCVAGLSTPARGAISLGERVLFDSAAGVNLPARIRRIGYVFQQSALLPHLDVAANIGFGLHRWARDERDHRVAELLTLTGLTGYGSRRPSRLSGGEQQRVALARALAPRPELLLLDEPFAALDARVRRRLRSELQELHAATQVPMVLVTHDLAEVRQLTGWLVVYGTGRVLQAGPTEDVLRSPGDGEVAAVLSGE